MNTTKNLLGRGVATWPEARALKVLKGRAHTIVQSKDTGKLYVVRNLDLSKLGSRFVQE